MLRAGLVAVAPADGVAFVREAGSGYRRAGTGVLVTEPSGMA
jgi:hypothetical protein